MTELPGPCSGFIGISDQQGSFSRCVRCASAEPGKPWRNAFVRPSLSSHRASRVARRWFVSLWALLCHDAVRSRPDTDDPAVAAPILRGFGGDLAAEQVPRESGVPRSVLRAIRSPRRAVQGTASLPRALALDGQHGGQGHLVFPPGGMPKPMSTRNFERGARSFDVGCFQINYRWHGDAFASLEEMFDPLVNTRYAARFLGRTLRRIRGLEQGRRGISLAHSLHANRYRARFHRIRARHGLGGGGGEGAAETFVGEGAAPVTRQRTRDPWTVPAPATARPNTSFPLLKARSGARSIGSLVPLRPQSRPPPAPSSGEPGAAEAEPGESDLPWPTILLALAADGPFIVMMVLPGSGVAAGHRCSRGASFALAILIFTITLFIERPLDFSAFPTILLAPLMCGLSLNISSTKLIIGQGPYRHRRRRRRDRGVSRCS